MFNWGGGLEMTTGLALGRFAPLHKGHQMMIELAIQEMEHVIVLIFQTDDIWRMIALTGKNILMKMVSGLQIFRICILHKN